MPTVLSPPQTGRAGAEPAECEGRTAPCGPHWLSKYQGICFIGERVPGWLLNPGCHRRHHGTQGKWGENAE